MRIRRGVRLKIQPQPLRVLALLVERAQAVVSREDLRFSLWVDDVHVDVEQSLHYGIRSGKQQLPLIGRDGEPCGYDEPRRDLVLLEFQ